DSGRNYGINCPADGNDTTFDDDAAGSMTAGSSPFSGSFRPQQPLAVFTGKSSAAVNGTWTLHVVDTFFHCAGEDCFLYPAQIGTGNVRCWSLSISPGLCADGGGGCATDLSIAQTASPDPVSAGSNLTYTLTV